MPDPTPRPSESNGKQPSTTDNLDQEPLGLHRPLLPANPLGQNWLSPKFLTPLGARPIAVINPTIFLKQDIPGYDPFINDFLDVPFSSEQPSLTNDSNSTENSSSSPSPTSPPSLSPPPSPSSPPSPIQQHPSSSLPLPNPSIPMDRAIPAEEILLPTHSLIPASSPKTHPADIQRQLSTDDSSHWEDDFSFFESEETTGFLEVPQTTGINDPPSAGTQTSVSLESPQTVEAIALSPSSSSSSPHPTPHTPFSPPVVQRNTELTPPQTPPKSVNQQGTIAPKPSTQEAIAPPSLSLQTHRPLNQPSLQTSHVLPSNPNTIERLETEVDTYTSSSPPSPSSSSFLPSPSSPSFPPSSSSLSSSSSPPSPPSPPTLPPPSPPSQKRTATPSIQRRIDLPAQPPFPFPSVERKVSNSSIQKREEPNTLNSALQQVPELTENSSSQIQRTSDVSQTNPSTSSLTNPNSTASSQENTFTNESISLEQNSPLKHQLQTNQSQNLSSEIIPDSNPIISSEKQSSASDPVLNSKKQIDESTVSQSSIQLSKTSSLDTPLSISPAAKSVSSNEPDSTTVTSGASQTVNTQTPVYTSSSEGASVEERSQLSPSQSETTLAHIQPSASLPLSTDVAISSGAQSLLSSDSSTEAISPAPSIQRHPDLSSIPIQRHSESSSTSSSPPVQRHPESPTVTHPIQDHEKLTTSRHPSESFLSSPPLSSPPSPSPSSSPSPPSPPSPNPSPNQRHPESSPTPSIPTSSKPNSSRQDTQPIISTASKQISAKLMPSSAHDVGINELETESLTVPDKTSDRLPENVTTISPQLEDTQPPELTSSKISPQSSTIPSTSPTVPTSLSFPASRISRSPAELPTVSAPPISASYPTALTETISSSNASDHASNDTLNELSNDLPNQALGDVSATNRSPTIQTKTAASQDSAIAPSPNSRSISSNAIPSSWSSIAELIGAPSEENISESSQISTSNRVQRLVESTPSNHPAIPTVRASRVNQPSSVVDDWLSVNEERGRAIAPSTSPNSSSEELIATHHAVIQDATLESLQSNTVSHQTSAGQASEKTDKLDELAWEIYHLLRQRLQVEQERQGNYYSGRLPY